MQTVARLIASLFVVFVGPFVALAVARADDFPEPPDTEKSTSRPMSAEEVARQAKLPTGFRLDVFAAEPDVQNPIGIATDERGRLWVAENYTWSGANFGNYDPKLRDRIIILADHDGDGRHDERKVFWDQGRKLTSVEVGLGGVWALDLPYLLFIPDRDRDDVPDGPPEIVLDGLDEHAVGHTPANGLRWGPDGWLYARHGIQATSQIGVPGAGESQRAAINTGVWRYHPTRRVVEAVLHGMTNSWGFDFDARGEMFVINTVIGHLWHVVPGAHVERMYGVDLNPHVYELIGQTANHVHWDTGQKWHEVRAGVTAGTDAAGGGHAHIGLMIYQGDNWPREYRDRVYTLNLHGRRINTDVLSPAGAGFSAQHGDDFCFVPDPWYRGMDLITGADGSVLIADWSDTGECHDHDGVHRHSGRIYRLAHGPRRAAEPFDLSRVEATALRERFFAENAWWGRQIQRQWQERAARGDDLSAVHAWLAEAAATRPAPEHRIQAIGALAACGGLSNAQLRRALDDRDAAVRAFAVRLVFDRCSPTGRQPLPDELEALARLADADLAGPVQLYLAAGLQRLHVDLRWDLAQRLAGHDTFADDRQLPLMLWYGVEPAVPRDPARAVELISSAKIGTLRRLIARRLTEEIESQPNVAADLTRLSARTDNGELARDIAVGMAEALRGWRQASAPAGWDLAAAKLKRSPLESTRRAIEELNLVFGDGRTLETLRAAVVDASADATARQQSLRALLASRPADFAPTLHLLLNDRAMSTDAIRGLALYDHPQTPHELLARLGLFSPAGRAEVISTLAGRVDYASALLAAIKAGTFERGELSAFHARQIQALGDLGLEAELQAVWGSVRATAEEKRAQIAQWRDRLGRGELGEASPTAGQELFRKTCANCHVLFGEGRKLGPDLTGSNRQNLDYLLENIFDPSASVGTEFRVTQVALHDGRTLNGVISAQTDRVLTLETAQEQVRVDRRDIERQETSPLSIMPDGLLQNFTPEQVRDLLAYLQAPTKP